MLANFQNSIMLQIDKLAGLKASLIPEEQIPGMARPGAADHCVIIQVSGGRNGFFALIMNEQDAALLSSHIIARAIDAEFPVEQVDSNLAANTIGELVNIVLGDYFMNHSVSAGATVLSSPRYSRVQDENSLLAQETQQIAIATEGMQLHLFFSIDQL